jgi:hypothetical protein
MEAIDTSQWLPKDIPVINAYRASKGDIKRNSDDKLQSITWLPHILHDMNRITKEHLDTAKSFERILIHAKRTLGICDIRGVLYDKHPAGQSHDTDVFLEIIRVIPKPESNIIVWLVWDDYNRGNSILALKVIGTIQHGLENAQKVLDNIAEKRNNALSTLPEVRPDLP